MKTPTGSLFAALSVLGTLSLALPAAAQEMASATVEYREVDLTYPAEAVVEAVRQATVAAQVTGRVIEVRRDAGQRVSRGELLMRIDERAAVDAVAESEAQVAQARANVENAKASYERAKSLVAKKFVSQAALDQAEAAYKAAEAQLKAALAGRGQAGTARSFATITAPISGVIAQRHTELGEMAAPGKPLITVFDPKGLRALANIPQYRLTAVGKATKVKVELVESGRWIEAKSTTVLPTADARTHVAQARVNLPDDLEGVVPGMFVRAHFVIGTAKKLLVPEAAVLRRGEVTAVYVMDADGTASLRQIRIGEPLAEGLVEVLAGLKPGERVALDPVKAGVVARAAPK